MEQKSLCTLIKKGRYEGKLEDSMAHYDKNLVPSKNYPGELARYILFNPIEDPYLLIALQNNSLEKSIPNIILCVTSYSGNLNDEITENFERETMLILDMVAKEVPKSSTVNIERLFRKLEEKTRKKEYNLLKKDKF